MTYHPTNATTSISISSGTATIGKVDQGAAGASAWPVSISGTLPVSVASLPLPSGAATEATLASIPVSQGSAQAGVKGPMVQALVSDAVQSYADNTIQPIQVTSLGRIRVAVTKEINGDDIFDDSLSGTDAFGSICWGF